MRATVRVLRCGIEQPTGRKTMLLTRKSCSLIVLASVMALAGCATAKKRAFEACAMGAVYELESILSAKPELVNARYWYGNTLLHFAAEEGRPAAVELLLQRGANVHAVDRFGETPLHNAVAPEQFCGTLRLMMSETEREEAPRKRVQVVRLLLSGGADIAARNMDRHTAFDLARSEEVRELLRPQAPGEAAEPTGRKLGELPLDGANKQTP